MVEIKSDWWTPLDVCRHLKYSMKIKWQALHDASSSHATWPNISVPSLIEWTRLNGDNWHLSISLKINRLIEWSCPNFPIDMCLLQ